MSFEKSWKYSTPGPNGVSITGIMEAPSLDEAKKRLKLMGMPNAEIREFDPNNPEEASKPSVTTEIPSIMKTEPPPGLAEKIAPPTPSHTGNTGFTPQGQPSPYIEDMKQIKRSAKFMMKPVMDLNIQGGLQNSGTSSSPQQLSLRRQRFFYGPPENMGAIFDKFLGDLNGRVIHVQVLNDFKGKTQVMAIIEYDNIEKEKKSDGKIDDNSHDSNFTGPILGGVQRGTPQSQSGGQYSDSSLYDQNGQEFDNE